MIASIPAMASLPKMVLAAAVCSVSERPPRLLRKLSKTSCRVFISPLRLVRLMPYRSMAPCILSVGAARFAREVLRLVPAMEPLTLAFAIRPRARETSSTEYFNAPATGATYLKDSPIIPTLVFAFALACARTSAKCPESDACSPKAVKASVTMSEVVARSSFEAAARLIMPSMPFSISSVFQPAIAI